MNEQSPSKPIAEDRLRNTRAWAAARLGQLSGAEVIVGAIDELLQRRADAPDDGYVSAFYEISELLGLPALPASPKETFETIMLPRLRELVARGSSPPSDALKILESLTSAVEHMRVPQTMADAALQVAFTLGPVVTRAREYLDRVAVTKDGGCATAGGRNPRYEGLFDGETEQERADRLRGVGETKTSLTYDQFWQRVRETGWNPSAAELRALLIAAERETVQGVARE